MYTRDQLYQVIDYFRQINMEQTDTNTLVNHFDNFKQDIQMATSEDFVQHHIQALALSDSRLASRATHQLVQIGEPAVQPLINVLRHEDMMVSIQAKAALHAIGTAAIPYLIEALGNTDLRMIVKTVLAKFGVDAVVPLIVALKTADETMEIAICSTLSMIGMPALSFLRASQYTSEDEVYAQKLERCIEVINREKLL